MNTDASSSVCPEDSGFCLTIDAACFCVLVCKDPRSDCCMGSNTSNTIRRWAQLLFLPPAWFSVACCYPCFLQQNVEWEVRSQHVALTVDGIRRLPKALPVVVGLLQDELFARHGQLTPLFSRHARQVCEGKAEINVRPAMHRQGPRKQDCAV